ncbi:MAG: superoxide dismutase [Planctomycetota bacterium]|nr:superoxide dismutase [Planctomycetota bacterium]
MQPDRLSRRELFGAAAGATVASLALAQPGSVPPVRSPRAPGEQPGDAPSIRPSGAPTPGCALANLGWDAEKGQYVLPPLPYATNALEPHIDAKTMEIHHGKHHQGYVSGANKALTELFQIRAGGDAALVKHWSRELSFHLSGHVNHALFWQMMAPEGKGGGGQPKGPLLAAIERDFGGYDKFVAHFKAAAAQVEGGGWAHLVRDPLSRRLMIVQQEKQQDMLFTGALPLLGCDVWEHAYYLKYQNQRASYVDAWFKVVNWSFVQCLFEQTETQ